MGSIVTEDPKTAGTLILIGVFIFLDILSGLDKLAGAWSFFFGEPPFQSIKEWWPAMTAELYGWLRLIIHLCMLGLLTWIFVTIRRQKKDESWLDALADKDSNQIAHRLLINDESKKAVLYLNAISPYAILRVYLFNSAVYSLTLEEKVEGRVFFVGSPLPDEAQIHRTKDLDKKVEIKHGEYHQLELRQSLQPVVIGHIQKAKGRAEFGVGQVAVWCTYQDRMGVTQRVRISLGGAPFRTDSNIKDADITQLEERLSERERRITRLNSRVKELLREKGTLPIYFEFPEEDMVRPNSNHVFAFVKVTNLTARTTSNVSVHIISVVKADEPEQSDYKRHLQTLAGLPLIIHGNGNRPHHEPHSKIEIHPGDAAMFDVVTLQRGTAQSSPETILWHAKGFQHRHPAGDEWRALPQATLHPGHYHMKLKAQGRDTPAETITIEFTNIRDEMWIRQIE